MIQSLSTLIEVLIRRSSLQHSYNSSKDAFKKCLSVIVIVQGSFYSGGRYKLWNEVASGGTVEIASTWMRRHKDAKLDLQAVNATPINTGRINSPWNLAR